MSDKKYRDDWPLRPLQGLGRLKFGMIREEAAEYDHIYGVPDFAKDSRGMVTEYCQNFKLELLFIDDKLKEIMVVMPFEQLCFAGKQIGDLDGYYIVSPFYRKRKTNTHGQEKTATRKRLAAAKMRRERDASSRQLASGVSAPPGILNRIPSPLIYPFSQPCRFSQE